MDATCVSKLDCEARDILWEDGGPGIDESLYDGWLNFRFSNDYESSPVCIKVYGLEQEIAR